MADNKNSNGKNGNGGSKIVIDHEERIKLDKTIGGITGLVIKHVAQKEGSNSPVSHYINAIVEHPVAGEIVLPRSYQFMARVRPPQVKDELKEGPDAWSNDPTFPASLAENDVCNAIAAVVMNHFAAKAAEAAATEEQA